MNVQSAGNGGREQSEDVSGSDNVDQYGQGQEVVGIEQAGNEEEDQSEILISPEVYIPQMVQVFFPRSSSGRSTQGNSNIDFF